jgi:hypothetical protein
MNKNIAAIPDFEALKFSPEIVRALDEIRFGPLCDDDQFAEFCWFIREYPRILRHHVEHAECRLESIQQAYKSQFEMATERLASEDDPDNLLSFSTVAKHHVNYRSVNAYWDFESFLQSASAALDIAARIVGTAYRGDTPPNFNRFCKTAPASKLKEIFIHNQSRWVKKMKAYRDCFIHYTSVDTILSINVVQYADAWEVRGKLPINPEAREILRFRYSRRTELLRYAIYTWKNLLAFDRAVAGEIRRLYRVGEYPKRHKSLFHLGRRRDESGGDEAG